MIHINDESVTVKGNVHDLLLQFMLLTHTLIDKCNIPIEMLAECFSHVAENYGCEAELSSSRDRLKDLLRGEHGEAIMTDLVNMMKEVIEDD